MQILLDKEINGHHIYLTNDNVPILLPCLYARYIVRNGLSIEEKNCRDRITGETKYFFEESEISKDAQIKRLTYLAHFLDWIDSNESPNEITLANHTALPADYINMYINKYIINTQEKSQIATQNEIIALRSYYNFLHFYFGNTYKKIAVYSTNREVARNNNKIPLLVKYILPETRELIYSNAKSLMHEIILRNGGELGCRSMENRGFLLTDQKANKKMYKGLLSLFHELELNPDKPVFTYYLSSLYTKYGRSRMLYIERNLLLKMKKYFEDERPSSDSNYLFICKGGMNKGECISPRYATDIYREISKSVRALIEDNSSYYSHYQPVEDASSYHHLRHSFGTDIFYEECRKRHLNYESISTESPAYIETARRMGHKVEGKNSPQTTKMYIHSCGYREQLLREAVNGV